MHGFFSTGQVLKCEEITYRRKDTIQKILNDLIEKETIYLNIPKFLNSTDVSDLLTGFVLSVRFRRISQINFLL